MDKFNPKIITDLINDQTKNIFLNYAENDLNWISKNTLEKSDFWYNRTIYHNQLIEDGFYDICKKIILDIKNIIQAEYNLQEKVYADSLVLCKWPEGLSQPPHCDDMSNVEDQHEHNKHRKFGSIIYLNDNYSGGKTYYPDHDFEINPQSKSVAIHLADCNHRHGVTKITNGTRYTLASFWTYDYNKSASEFRDLL